MSNRLNMGLLQADAVSHAGVARHAISMVVADPILLPIPITFQPPLGKLSVSHSPTTVVFRLDGVARWVIDLKRFAGTPTLAFAPTPQNGMRIELKGALYPGTELPADFVCVLGPRGGFGTPMDLTMTLGGFHARVTAERWLAGQQLMQSPVRFGTTVCPLDADSKLSLAGEGEARFLPAWLLLVNAPEPLASITGLGPALDSSVFLLKLALPGEPSLSAHPKLRRTQMVLAAGEAVWRLTPALLALPIGTLAAQDGLFSLIEIEAGEGAGGDVERILVAFSTRTDGLSLTLGEPITDLDGGPARLALALPRYAMVFDPGRTETLLSARFDAAPRWLCADGFALQVGDPAGPPAFALETARDDAGNGAVVTRFICTPALLLAAAPLATAQAFSRPLPPAVPTFLAIVDSAGSLPGWGLLVGPLGAGQRRLSIANFAVQVLRRDDLLSLEFLFFNLALEGGGESAPGFAVIDPDLAAQLVVRFDAPQNLAEQAFLEEIDGAPAETPSPPPVRVLAAGPSRLAFLVNGALPYTLEALLDWADLDASLVPVAVPDTPATEPAPDPAPLLREPLPTETAIEAPWRLFLSPDASGGWKHALDAVTLGGRTELWHTRLGVRTVLDQGHTVDDRTPARIRAVWTTNYRRLPLPPHVSPEFRMSLDPNDRHQIVRQSADFTIPLHRPESIEANQLFLSSLGAWMDVRGEWTVLEDAPVPGPVPAPPLLSLESWRHRAAMGRDNYVRVVTAGYLLPFGHRASLVKVTERKFQSIGGAPTTAYLRQRFFIVVKQPVLDYAFLPKNQQHELPFRQVRITTLVTPFLKDPTRDAISGTYSFLPIVDGQPFPFHLLGTDAEQTAEFTAPLYFVEVSNGGVYRRAVNSYNLIGHTTRPFSGQNVAFAQSATPGDTTYQTVDMTFHAALRVSRLPVAPPVRPLMQRANIIVPAVQQITGDPGPMAIRYFKDYLEHDFGPGGVFVENAAAPLNVSFQGDQSGGVATPNLNVTGLSRKFGTVSGAIGTIASGTFDPADYLGAAGATLFGVIPLKDLVQAVFGEGLVPALVTNRLPDRIETRLHWTPLVKDYTLGPITLGFTGDAANSLTLDTLITTWLTGGPPQASVHGTMRDFYLSLGGVIRINFTLFEFRSVAGAKTDVNVSLDEDHPLVFEGDLSFLQTLQDLIPASGFEDPPFLNVSVDGLTAGFTLAIPSIGVGVFSLENLKLAAALTLPFVSGPLRFRFAFCEREDPFIVTVSMLGGGGFFGISLGPDGVEVLEASIEVSASVSIDVGVASGNLHIMAGVYLKIAVASTDSQLTGYLRAGGAVDVLGLISASIEFYLGFTYYPGPRCHIAGEASVVIAVHVLFFSTSVTATMRREFADPKISVADLIGLPDWTEYCEAFAA